ncbi:MAG: MFS transporter, partial [Mailhella sp.]|nr:MFS transporter [Mailhella sp.]
DRAGHGVGRVFLALDKDAIMSLVFNTAKAQIGIFLAITLGECVLLALLLWRFAPRTAQTGAAKGEEAGTSAEASEPSGKSSGRSSGVLRLCFMTPLVLGQILFLLLLHAPLSDLYHAELKYTGRQISSQLAWDLERLASLGLPVSRIESMDSWIMARQKPIASLGMAVFDEESRLKCAASAHRRLTPEEWDEVSRKGRLTGRDLLSPRDWTFAGRVEIAMDPAAVTAGLRSVLLDNMTMTLIAALFLSELIFLLLMGGNAPAQSCVPATATCPGAGPAPATAPAPSLASQPGFMRPVIFACLFGTELSMSYVPIRIGELGLDLFGLAPELVSGLPISCELFMAALGMFVGGFWSQRSGWRPMLMAGMALAFAGSLFSWLSPGPLPFILSRGLSGLGYGFMNLAAQVFVIDRSGTQNRAQNLAFMFAGLYAGTLCGSALGGLIADRLGYAAVFPASALALLVLTVLLWRQLPREPWTPTTVSRTRLTFAEAAAFALDRRMGALLAFFIIPNALMTVCLFQYFIPLFLSQSGTSAASIGRVFLVYCVIVMFAGPAFGKMLDKARRMELPLFAAQVVCAGCVAALLCFEGVTAAMACVALLGVNTSIAANGQGPYALSLLAAKRLGHERTMGFYNVAMRLGQVLGPLSLGAMISLWDVRTGLSALAGFALVCAVLFLLLSWKKDDDQ